MLYICKIDKEIYSVITKDIKSDDIIITDERIEHIKNRHPKDIDLFYKHIHEIIRDPDYILKANKPNTALILKNIVVDNKKFQLILRLKTSTDPKEYKNSVITFLNINENKYNRYLKYKKYCTIEKLKIYSQTKSRNRL